MLSNSSTFCLLTLLYSESDSSSASCSGETSEESESSSASRYAAIPLLLDECAGESVTRLISSQIEHRRNVGVLMPRWWLVKWTDSFIGDVGNPRSWTALPPWLCLAQLQPQVMSWACGGDTRIRRWVVSGLAESFGVQMIHGGRMILSFWSSFRLILTWKLAHIISECGNANTSSACSQSTWTWSSTVPSASIDVTVHRGEEPSRTIAKLDGERATKLGPSLIMSPWLWLLDIPVMTEAFRRRRRLSRAALFTLFCANSLWKIWNFLIHT